MNETDFAVALTAYLTACARRRPNDFRDLVRVVRDAIAVAESAITITGDKYAPWPEPRRGEIE